MPGRPTEAPTIPQQASDHVPDQVQLPEPMPLPDVPDLGGAPDFPPLDLPTEAGTGIDMALEVVPDLPDFFDL